MLGQTSHEPVRTACHVSKGQQLLDICPVDESQWNRTPGGTRTPNLLIRNQGQIAVAGSERCRGYRPWTPF